MPAPFSRLLQAFASTIGRTLEPDRSRGRRGRHGPLSRGGEWSVAGEPHADERLTAEVGLRSTARYDLFGCWSDDDDVMATMMLLSESR